MKSFFPLRASFVLGAFMASAPRVAGQVPANTSLSGTLTRTVDGAPLRGVWVALQPAAGESDAAAIDWQDCQLTTTDADGHYAFTLVPEGEYDLLVSLGRAVPSRRVGRVMAETDAPAAVEAALDGLAWFDVRLLRDEEQSLSAAQVDLLLFQLDKGRWVTDWTGTDDGGQATLYVEPGQGYCLLLSSSDGWAIVDLSPLEADTGGDLGEVRLQPGGVVRGSAVEHLGETTLRQAQGDGPGPAQSDGPGPAQSDGPGPAQSDGPGPAQGDAVPDAQVTLRPYPATQRFPCFHETTAENGGFAFPMVPPGDYTLNVFDPALERSRSQGVRVTAGEDTAVTIALPTPGRIVGQLLDADGQPVANADAILEALIQFGMEPAAPGSTRVRTDGQGCFAVDPARPGQTVLATWQPGLGYGVFAPVDVPEGEEVRDVTLHLRRGVPLAGLVRAAGTGKPIPGATVTVHLSPCDFWPGLEGQAETDATGRFTLCDAPPGHGKLTVSAPGFVGKLLHLEVKAEETPPEVVIELGEYQDPQRQTPATVASEISACG